jgi:hypothetical protein
LHFGPKEYHVGELTLHLQREEESVEMTQQIAAL